MPDLGKLREQIAAGDYRLDATSIASALLDYANIAESPSPSARGPHHVTGHGAAPATSERLSPRSCRSSKAGVGLRTPDAQAACFPARSA